MCFRFDSCFGVGRGHDDYCSPPAKHNAATTTRTPHQPPPAQRNGHYYGQGHQAGFHHGNGYHGHAQPQQQGFHHQTATADEADRKASNDARRGPKDVRGYAAGAQEKAYVYSGADDDALNHPAWNAKVGDDDAALHAAQCYYYHERGGPGHKEDTADHRYPTATTADRERY